MTEARHYVKLIGEKVECRLCPHKCIVAPGNRGICRVRQNRAGKLYSQNYGRCSSLALDPIEKKPLYHFYPGSLILSAGTVGCNFGCQFCQNWQIAHQEAHTVAISPQQLVQKAQASDSLGIAYTYSEPLVWFEFVADTAQLAREAGLKNVMVSNGFIEPEPLAELLPWIDAWNIDIKGFNQEFYRKVVRGSYQPVLRTAAVARQAGAHVEITTLLVTGLNDDLEEIAELAQWVAGELGVDTPLHLSRYYPQYRLKAPPTPLATMYQARQLAQQHLHYVYLGNVADPEVNNTSCPACGATVIRRLSYQVNLSGLDGESCRACGSKLAIIR
ncbi:MAG: AmmeMemoRadiSam system radical SAM enzyme [Clostridia bacterium]|nr:AmmeMemoRadiSam system radical SAM enzyme [Clostridia bacterium]